VTIRFVEEAQSEFLDAISGYEEASVGFGSCARQPQAALLDFAAQSDAVTGQRQRRRACRSRSGRRNFTAGTERRESSAIGQGSGSGSADGVGNVSLVNDIVHFAVAEVIGERPKVHVSASGLFRLQGVLALGLFDLSQVVKDGIEAGVVAGTDIIWDSNGYNQAENRDDDDNLDEREG
jgi:hypothetical protein